MKEIREVLGVRASDNLQHAELILAVEGEEDRRELRALLRYSSPRLADAIREQSLGFEFYTVEQSQLQTESDS